MECGNPTVRPKKLYSKGEGEGEKGKGGRGIRDVKQPKGGIWSKHPDEKHKDS